MQRQQVQKLILASSALLMLGSLVLEAISKLRLISSFEKVASETGSKAMRMAASVRDAEGWLYLAVACAISGVAVAVFSSRESGKDSWWFRVTSLAGLIFWAILALLYFFGLPYPLVATGYALCFGVLLVSQLNMSKGSSGF